MRVLFELSVTSHFNYFHSIVIGGGIVHADIKGSDLQMAKSQNVVVFV